MRTLALTLLALASCSSPGQRLDALIEDEWAGRSAPVPGFEEDLKPFQDPRPELLAARVERDRETLATLEAIDPAGLELQDRVSRMMLARELRDRIADFEHGEWRQPLTSDWGFHMAAAGRYRGRVLKSPEEAQLVLGELRKMPRYFDLEIANLRVGLEDGVALPREILDGYTDVMRVHVVEDPTRSVFYEPFASLPEHWEEADRVAVQQEARQAILEGPVRAYTELVRFFEEEYLPGARANLGLTDCPGGEAWYDHLVRRFTTLDLTAREVHELGLEEVARIRADMQVTMQEAGFEGTFPEFLAFLRTDERFYAKTPEELLAYASFLSKRADRVLPRFFGQLPRLPYGVEPVPDAIAPRYTGGRYVPSSRPTEAGLYWVNTYALESRPLYVMPALTLHEAVPGHHLQIALAAELEDLPEFRRRTYVNAFGEGWALYCEYLGTEMGLYDDPYDEFGRQSYEMWRAVRLVVDTGLHAFGWTRQQAIDYLASNTALSLHECTTEVDRYIAWPGQALSYKIGELEIRRLRTDAEERLGAAFDLRDFHDQVIGYGALPLDALGVVIEDWVRGQLAGEESTLPTRTAAPAPPPPTCQCAHL